MIDGVIVTPLKQFFDERGKVMHMLRNDAKSFTKFGEIYFSTVHPNKVKGWHLHGKMTLNYAVVVGEIKLVLYDARQESKTKGQVQEFFLLFLIVFLQQPLYQLFSLKYLYHVLVLVQVLVLVSSLLCHFDRILKAQIVLLHSIPLFST